MAEASIEDLYFQHYCEGYYYGYRQNKCFKFNKNLELVDTVDVDFPFTTRLGCPVYVPTRNQQCIDTQNRFGIV